MTELRADCSRCFALCCVGLGFTRSADFAADKPAGTPCVNLTAELRCGVHATLRESGWAGCVSYDCFGAGQRVSQVSFAGADWRQNPELAEAMFAALPVMRQLHEMLFYLDEAQSWCEQVAAAATLTARLAAARQAVEDAASSAPAALLALDVAGLRADVAPALREVSAAVRAHDDGPQHAGSDLAGARLVHADLRGADLRGASLIGADLTRARLARADLIGADLRAANLSGADLRDALFLTQTQLNSAGGDPGTTIPERLARPAHWT